MIFELLFQSVEVFIEFILDLIPDVPPISPSIEAASTNLIDLAANSGGIIVEIYTPELFSAIIATFIALFQFENLYHLILWVIRKIPISIH